jgi:hypothetical protein
MNDNESRGGGAAVGDPLPVLAAAGSEADIRIDLAGAT